MRVSTDKNDPGYPNFQGYYKVTVDGVEVQEVITADAEKGYVLKGVEPLQTAWCGDEQDYVILQEEMYGDVVITKID